jgi:hypothetical protein
VEREIAPGREMELQLAGGLFETRHAADTMRYQRAWSGDADVKSHNSPANSTCQKFTL